LFKTLGVYLLLLLVVVWISLEIDTNLAINNWYTVPLIKLKNVNVSLESLSL
jgi:hypothetical protein